MRNQIALTLVCLAALAAPALSQQAARDTELQVQGTLTIATSGNQDSSGGVNLNVGRFFTDSQEIGVLASGTFQSDGKFTGSGGPFYRYNFSTGTVVPYLGGAPTASFGSSGNGKGARLALEAGIRYFVDRKTAFSVEASTSYSFDDKEFSKQLVFLFGFSHLWGK
jgi:hypothetical protein